MGEDIFDELNRPEYPYAMLMEKGVGINGGKILDLFRGLIWQAVNMSSLYVYRNFRLNESKSPVSNVSRLLFVMRDWCVMTTLNQEILRSLYDYCGVLNVEVLVLKRYDDIVTVIEKKLISESYSHIMVDTRIFETTKGLAGFTKAMYAARNISFLLKKYKIVCLCNVTDWEAPVFRLLADLITGDGGLILSWGSVGFHEVAKSKHNRKIGPLIPPVSRQTLRELDLVEEDEYMLGSDVAIMGLNYEPRKSLMEKLLPELKQQKINFYYNTRKDLSFSKYLLIYKFSKIGLNTNWIVGNENRYHLTGRNIEVMSTGCLLIAHKCYGLDLYFQDGVDYVSFNDFTDLIEKIKFYMADDISRKKIADSGKKRVRHLIESFFVYKEIDKALGIFDYPSLPVI